MALQGVHFDDKDGSGRNALFRPKIRIKKFSGPRRGFQILDASFSGPVNQPDRG
jgi:hypothetical protein